MQRGKSARSQIGKWENCGGEVDEGEQPQETIIREVREELGVSLKNLEVLFVTQSSDGEPWEVTMFTGLCEGTPAILELNQCSAVKWVDVGDLVGMDLCTFTLEDFKKLGYC